MRHDIADVDRDIDSIALLRQRCLDSADGNASELLVHHTKRAKACNAAISSGIEQLEIDLTSTTEGSRDLKGRHIPVIKSLFGSIHARMPRKMRYNKRLREVGGQRV